MKIETATPSTPLASQESTLLISLGRFLSESKANHWNYSMYDFLCTCVFNSSHVVLAVQVDRLAY